MSLFGINKWHIETSLDMMNDGNSQKEIETKTREDIGEMKKWVEKELSVKSKYSKEYGDLLSKWLEAYKTKIQKDTQNQVAGVKDNISGNKPGNNKGGNETSEGGESPASKPDSKKPEQNNTSEGILELGENESITIGDKTIKKGQGVTYNLNESGSFTGKYKKDGDKVGEIEIEKSGSKQKVFIKVKEINSYIEGNTPPPNNETNNTKPSTESKTTPDNKEQPKQTEGSGDIISSFSTKPNNGETKTSSKDGKSILVGTFDSNNKLYNGREIVKGEKIMRVYENGKHKYTYEGEFKNGKFNGIIKYFDGTGRVDVVENGKAIWYEKYVIAYYLTLLGASLTGVGTIPSLAIGIAGDGYDLTQDEVNSHIMQTLRGFGVIDTRYRAGKKSGTDYFFDILGLIPLVGMGAKYIRLTKYIESLPAGQQKEIAQAVSKIEVMLKDNIFLSKTKAKVAKGSGNTTEQAAKSTATAGKTAESGEVTKNGTKAGKIEKAITGTYIPQSSKKFSGLKVEEVKSLNPGDRILAAEEFLQSNVTKTGKKAIEEAHEATNIKEKVKILEKAGFDKSQRKLLLKNGICGKQIQVGDILAETGADGKLVLKKGGRRVELKDLSFEEQEKLLAQSLIGGEKQANKIINSIKGSSGKVYKWLPEKLRKEIEKGPKKYMIETFKTMMWTGLITAILESAVINPYFGDNTDARFDAFIKSFFFGALAGGTIKVGLEVFITKGILPTGWKLVSDSGKYIWKHKGKTIAIVGGSYIAWDRFSYDSWGEMLRDYFKKSGL